MLKLKDFSIKDGNAVLVLTGDTSEVFKAFCVEQLEKGFTMKLKTTEQCEICKKAVHISEDVKPSNGEHNYYCYHAECAAKVDIADKLIKNYTESGRQYYYMAEAVAIKAGKDKYDGERWEAANSVWHYESGNDYRIPASEAATLSILTEAGYSVEIASVDEWPTIEPPQNVDE